MQGEFLHFLHEDFVHLAHAQAFRFHLGGGGHSGQVSVLPDVGFGLGKCGQPETLGEYIVGPAV